MPYTRAKHVNLAIMSLIEIGRNGNGPPPRNRSQSVSPLALATRQEPEKSTPSDKSSAGQSGISLKSPLMRLGQHALPSMFRRHSLNGPQSNAFDRGTLGRNNDFVKKNTNSAVG